MAECNQDLSDKRCHVGEIKVVTESLLLLFHLKLHFDETHKLILKYEAPRVADVQQ